MMEIIEKCNIIRKKLTSDVGLLLGNGEMGGLLRNDGLGFDAVWLTDFWNSESERASVGPFRLFGPEVSGPLSRYRQELSLREAVVCTEVHYESETSYKCQCFFSQKERHVMVFRLENLSSRPQQWTLSLPGSPELLSSNMARVVCNAKASHMSLPFTSLAWTVSSSVPLEETETAALTFILEPGQSVNLVSALLTSFDGLDFEERSEKVASSTDTFEELLDKHICEWASLWGRFEINLPASKYAETFYRSLYYLFSITGASSFLPGVCQFSDPGWGMIPFTSDIGFTPMLLACINHHDRAISMLREFYKPDALRMNARKYLNILGGCGVLDKIDDAFCFAHMINITGTEFNFVFGRQRHLDGFGPAMFHRVASLCPSDSDCAEMAYQTLKGCAAFWLRMLFRDDTRNALMIRRTLDLDETTQDVSVASSVIACHWTLMMFARYARNRGADLEMAKRCEESLGELYWPANAERFLSFPDDPEESVPCQYHCIRSFSTLAYPYCELTNIYDHDKVDRTLDATHKRNQLDKSGSNTMTINMYALTEACLGHSEEAFRFASLSLERLDQSGVAMGEAQKDSLFYFVTGYTTFALATVQMLLQSYDGVIRPFPALPKDWMDVSFSKLPAIEGIQVSAEMDNGKIKHIIYEKDGVVLLETTDPAPVRVRRDNGRLSLSVANKEALSL